MSKYVKVCCHWMSQATHGELEGSYGREIAVSVKNNKAFLDTSDGEYSAVMINHCPNCGKPIEIVEFYEEAGRILSGEVEFKYDYDDDGVMQLVDIAVDGYDLGTILNDGENYEITIRKL